MQYSEMEQLTGDFWLDGKPIYTLTHIANVSTVQPLANYDINFTIDGMDKFLECKYTSEQVNNQDKWVPGEFQGLDSTNFSFITTFYRKLNRTVVTSILCQDQSLANWISNSVLYITVFYTRTS